MEKKKNLKWEKGNFWHSAGDIIATSKMQDKTGKQISVTFQIIKDSWGTKKKWTLNKDWKKVENFSKKSTAKLVANLIYNG